MRLRDLDAVITLSSLRLPCRIDDPTEVAEHLRSAVPAGVQRHRHACDLGADRPAQGGVPLAMQIAGHAFDEATVYRVAHAYCEATGFARPKRSRRSARRAAAAGAYCASSPSRLINSPLNL